MNEKSATCEVVVPNPQGFHARPASAFVKAAMKFKASIHVVKETRPNEKVDGKQVIELLLLSAPQGTKLMIYAQGEDAEEAVATLSQLVQSGFGESEGTN